MLEGIWHRLHDNGFLAKVNGKVRRGCWECYHIIVEYQRDKESKCYCEITKDDDGKHLNLQDIYIVPVECIKRIL
jgi:hypothetical protein